MTINTPNKIEAGDTVEVIRGNGYILPVGSIHTVQSVKGMYVYLVNPFRGVHGWDVDRFTKVVTPTVLQVGDTVECIVNDGWGSQPVGSKFIVRYADKGGKHQRIGFDEDSKPEYYASRFKKVANAVSPVVTHKWIVCALDKSGNIKPSSAPKAMAHERQAVSVSKSMAEQHVGETFAAVSYVVGPTFRAEVVEVKTTSTKVVQV